MKKRLRNLAILWLSPLPLCGQALFSLPPSALPSTAALAGMVDDAIGWTAQPGAGRADRSPLAALRCLRMPAEGAPLAMQAAMVVPAGPGRVSLQGWHAGASALREGLAMVSYDAPLWETFSMGVGLGYGRLAVPGHASVRRLHARWGAVWHVKGGLRLGFRLEAAPRLSGPATEETSRLPVRIAFGIGYQLSEQASLAAELLREGGRRTVLTPVVHYRPLPDVLLRAGIRTDNGGIIVVMTYRMGRLGVGAGGQQAGPLGWCGELTMDWRLEKGEARD